MPRIKLNWVGEVVAGRYRIEAELGEGGMGTVYSALDLQSNGRVAIKTPRIALLEDPQFFKRFEREMKALQQLRHPHLVPVLDVGTHNRIPFFVMPYLGGGNLHQRFQKKRASRLQDLFPWLAQLASALDYLHQHKLVHRDVKPANVLFDEQQTAYLTDLGAVKVQEGSELDAKTKLTQTGTALGTPAYMAPEVLFGEPFDGRCDQYSLAAIVYEAFAGRLPHQGRTLPELIQSHFKTQPERLEKLCRVPVGVADAVARALARDPKQRFASCLEFVRAVQQGFSHSAHSKGTDPVSSQPQAVAEPVKPISIQADQLSRRQQGAPLVQPVPPGPGNLSPPQLLPTVPAAHLPTPTFGGRRFSRRIRRPLSAANLALLVALVGACALGLVVIVWLLGSFRKPDNAEGPSHGVTQQPHAASIQQPTKPAQVPGANAAVPEEPQPADTKPRNPGPRVWHVNFTTLTLEEAIRKAQPGDTILLAAGRFTLRQGIVVDKPLVIRGARDVDSPLGEKTHLLSWAREYVIQFTGRGPWTLEDLVIENVGSSPVNLVVVQGGEITIQRCRFTGAFFDKEGAPVRGGCGIWIRGDAIARIYQCLCDRNGLHGIEVDDKAQPVLEGNTCEKNTHNGIAYFGGAGGTARNNVCRSNGYHGIEVSRQAQPVLEGNTCEKNTYSGIAYFGSAGGTARNNVCRSNGYDGIGVQQQARPVLEGNTCENNTGSGIAYFGSAGGTARNNTCRGNDVGIGVVEQARPVLEGNTCEKNTDVGIGYAGSAGGTARNNVCRGNERYGIYVGDQAQPMLEGNTCEKNTVCGIAYLGSAGGTARNNTCRGNGVGIGVVEQAQPMLEGNTCEKNTECGIAYLGSAGGTARNNTCRDNDGDGIFVGEKAWPELFGNQCYRNRYGICVSRTAKPKLGPNKLFDNRSGDLGTE